MVEINTTNSIGFCFGVHRAVEKIKSEENENIILIGKPIHNDNFITRLLADIKNQNRNVILIDNDRIDELSELKTADEAAAGLSTLIPEGATAIIRAHGVPYIIHEALEKINVNIEDMTCVCVKKIQDTVKNNITESDLLIIIGDKNHPEIKGIASRSAGETLIYSDYGAILDDMDAIREKNKRILCVTQTTHDTADFIRCKDLLTKYFSGIKIFDTICGVTGTRQKEAAELAEKSDIFIVAGGAKSANTQKLYSAAKKFCDNAFIIETSEQLPKYKLKQLIKNGALKVGITAGASTPDSILEGVIKIMTDVKNEATANETVQESSVPDNSVSNEPAMENDELSFGELFEQSYTALNRGEKIKGTVSAISANEIHVDLGIKQTGVLPYDEITDESGIKLNELFKVGDEIEVQILKINDQDGTALLSKKRIDAYKNWNNIIQYHADGTSVDGKIVFVVNGGIIAVVDGIKVFIPASQANVSKNVDLRTLVGKAARVKIIDVNEQKHRAIASIRAAMQSDRKIKEDAVWSDIAVGKKYDGVVKSITNYGAFVDIGGVDGLVHVTELMWGRIKHPSEIVKVGDTLSVYVKEIDAEKKRISLGHKKESDNPWVKFTNEYKAGDTAEVKIMNLLPFGAFAEIIPGVDGLIHISQISEKRIAKPSDVLNIGDVHKVKITAIDNENQKISLSIREIIREEEKGSEELTVHLSAELSGETEPAGQAVQETAGDGTDTESGQQV